MELDDIESLSVTGEGGGEEKFDGAKVGGTEDSPAAVRRGSLFLVYNRHDAVQPLTTVSTHQTISFVKYNKPREIKHNN